MKELDWRKYHTFIQNIETLTTAQKNVLSWMIYKADGIGGKCTIKKKELAEITNISKKTIERCFKKLSKENIITKKKKEFTYKINPTEEWNVKINEFIPEGHEIFDQIPFWLDMITILNENDKNVYIRITGDVFRNEERYEIRKKMQTVADQLGISKKTVARIKKRLLEHGMIQVKHTLIEQARHRPGKYARTTPDEWSQKILQNILKNVKKVEQKIRHSGGQNRIPFDLETTRKIRHFVGPYVHNTRDSLRESEDNKLSSSSSSGNYLGGSATSKVSLNRKLFKNKTQNKNTLEQNKHKQESLEQNNKSLRSKLKDSHKHEENKRNKKLEVKPSTKTLSILNRWNKLCDEYPRIYTRPKQDQKNKTYREIVDSLNKLFRGTLYARGNAVLPQGFEPFEQKFTLKEVETFLERLHIQLIDPNVGVTPFKNRKANLREFLMGSPRTGAPSKLLSCCWYEPKSLNIKNTEDVETLKKLYREHVDPDRVFTFRDLEAFDKCASWGEPLYTQLERTFGQHSNFVTMVYMSSIKSVQKVANGSINPTLFGKEFVERMTKQRMQKLGYTL